MRSSSEVEVAYRDVGVAVRAVSGDSGQVRRVGNTSPGALERDLRALGVPLRVVGLVQRNQLVADEVVARREVGNRARPLPTANEVGDAPAGRALAVEEDGLAVAREAALVDLEPAAARAVAGAEVAVALVHPDHDGALGVSPLLPGRDDLVAGRGDGAYGGVGAAVAADLGVGGA